jgi:hypothetical protein
MKKHMFTLAFLVIGVFIQSCHKINGEGPVVTETLSLRDFSGLTSGIDADVYYTQDSFYSVEIQAQQNILNIIETPVVNGELNLQFQKYKNVWQHSPITVYIRAPYLNIIGINGSGNIRVAQPVSCNKLSLKVNGSGTVQLNSFTGSELSSTISGSGSIAVLNGTVSSQSLHTSGSGNINVGGLRSTTANVQISGSGNSTLNVTNYLDVNISGSGSTFYYGSPTVHTTISGSGKVIHL